MRHIRIERKAPVRMDRHRYDVLPLDPRDPDVLHAKLPIDRHRIPTRRRSR